MKEHHPAQPHCRPIMRVPDPHHGHGQCIQRCGREGHLEHPLHCTVPMPVPLSRSLVERLAHPAQITELRSSVEATILSRRGETDRKASHPAHPGCQPSHAGGLPDAHLPHIEQVHSHQGPRRQPHRLRRERPSRQILPH